VKRQRHQQKDENYKIDFMKDISFGDIISQVSDLIIQYAFSVLGAVVILVVGFILAGLVERWVKSGLSQLKPSDPTLNSFLSNVARYAILIIVGIAVLGQFGIQPALILAA
jgi:small conductance mechanosensitive channel